MEFDGSAPSGDLGQVRRALGANDDVPRPAPQISPA